MPQASEVLDRPVQAKVWHGEIDLSTLEDTDLQLRPEFDEEREDRIAFTGQIKGREAFTFFMPIEQASMLIAQTGAQLALALGRRRV